MAIKVNPQILVWARETAALSIEEAASDLQFKDSKKSTATEKLQALEAGERCPSQSQLEKMSQVYRRPLVTFYLARPPRKSSKGHKDFRQTPDKRTPRENAMLDALLRDVWVRQETVREMLEEEEEFEAPNFIGSMHIDQEVDQAASIIADKLKFDHVDLNLRRGKPNDLFKRLRTAAEDAGVFVLILNDLGSYHTTIPASVFRGFAIADNIAPFVVINGKDAHLAHAFTLIHELTHICLGETGVSESEFASTTTPMTENSRIERFCNDVAGEFLLPTEQFRQGMESFDGNDFNSTLSAVKKLAKKWSVSEPAAAYRLNRSGYLVANVYKALFEEYDRRWKALQKKQKEERERRKKLGKKGGVDSHKIKLSNLGTSLIGLVHRAVRDDTLSHTKAASVLGGSSGSVEPILRKFESRQKFFLSKKKTAK